MSVDFRALCAELILRWDVDGCDWKPQHQAKWEAALSRARALLEADGPAAVAGEASPPAEGEVAELVAWLRDHASAKGRIQRESFTRAADLLERQAAPVPVPVTERLPGPEDCDEEGYCWRWNMIAGSWARQPISRRWYEFETHWLPAHALPLPVPGGEVEP